MTTDPNATPSAGQTPPAAPPAAPPAGQTPPAPPPGNGQEAWYAKADYGFDREMQDYLAGKNFGSLGDAMKAARQFEQIARDRNALTGPAEGKLLEWEGWQKFGWNPDRAQYAVEKPQLKDGVPYADGFHDALANGFHKARLAPDQVKAVMAELSTAFNADHEATLAEISRQDAALKASLERQWGANYGANVEKAKRAASALLSKEQQAVLEDAFGSHELIQIFHKIGEAVGEDRLVTNSNSGQGGFGGQTPEQARAERKRLEADPAFMKSLTDPLHPLHDTNKAKRRALFELEAKALG